MVRRGSFAPAEGNHGLGRGRIRQRGTACPGVYREMSPHMGVWMVPRLRAVTRARTMHFGERRHVGVQARACSWGSIFLVGLLLFALGCDRGGGGKELARVNDVSITLEEFRQIAERQPLEAKMRMLTEEAQREFLETYVIPREVLYQEAQKRGLDKNKELLAKFEDIKRAMIIDTLVDEVLRGKEDVSPIEIQDYYRKNQDKFSEPREVKIRQIVVPVEPLLRQIQKRLAQGESFENLASMFNPERFRADGGNIGYIRRGQFDPLFAQFEDAAFSLREKGEVSDLVRSPYGFHLLRLEDKRGKVLRPLEKVQEPIRIFLQKKKRQEAYLEYLKQAKEKAKIMINEAVWAREHPKEPGAEGRKK